MLYLSCVRIFTEKLYWEKHCHSRSGGHWSSPSLPRSAALFPLPQRGRGRRVSAVAREFHRCAPTQPPSPQPSPALRGRGLAARSQRAAERLMQQRLFQRVERGEFLLVEGFAKLTKNHFRSLDELKKIYARDCDFWHRAYGRDFPFGHHVGSKLLPTLIRN